MNDVLNPVMGGTEDDDDTQEMLITRDGLVQLHGFSKHLAELQSNEDIYLVEPDLELAEKYSRWMEVVDQEKFTQSRLDLHLGSSHILREMYESLVPQRVSHMQFWQRYLFKRALLEDALANAESAERRAKQEVNSTASVSPLRKSIIHSEQPKRVLAEVETPEAAVAVTEDNLLAMEKLEKELCQMSESELKWAAAGQEDFANCVELSEEEQARLLAEYELEIQERDRKLTPKKEPIKSKAQQPKGYQNKAQKTAKDPVTAKATAKGTAAVQKQQQSGNKTSNSSSNAKKTGKAVGEKKEAAAAAVAPAQKEDSDESWEKEFDLDE